MTPAVHCPLSAPRHFPLSFPQTLSLRRRRCPSASPPPRAPPSPCLAYPHPPYTPPSLSLGRSCHRFHSSVSDPHGLKNGGWHDASSAWPPGAGSAPLPLPLVPSPNPLPPQAGVPIGLSPPNAPALLALGGGGGQKFVDCGSISPTQGATQFVDCLVWTRAEARPGGGGGDDEVMGGEWAQNAARCAGEVTPPPPSLCPAYAQPLSP